MMISGKTKVYGVIGNPIEHSFSPFIHNMLAKETGIDMVYTTFHVRDGQLENAVKGLDGLNIQGINVTVPYKLDIMAYMDEVDEMARNIGAMNTVVREGNTFKGYNTDAIGLKMSLDREGISLKGQSVLIIGAGGAARAVAVMCAEAGAKHIAITNRTAEKAEELTKLISERYSVDTEVVALETLKDRSDLKIAFQTTPVGMSPHVGNNPVYETKYYKSLEVAVDLIYNPTETHFLKEAKKAGARTINGLGMLYYQAVKAFELWNDVVISDEVNERCLEKFIGEMVKDNE